MEHNKTIIKFTEKRFGEIQKEKDSSVKLCKLENLMEFTLSFLKVGKK